MFASMIKHLNICNRLKKEMMFSGQNIGGRLTYLIAIKLSIFYTIPIFEVIKGFYSTCTRVFWLPTLDKFD